MVFKFENGNKIHIKDSLKGSFTRYCGGNVTEECIRRGKNSSDPKIRKKATFAANARKWKHSKGGAFREGVNVLDSTPSLYKTIKKKIKMAEAGTKFDWNGLGNAVLNSATDIISSSLLNRAIKLLIKRNEAAAKAYNKDAMLQSTNYGKLFENMYRRLQESDFKNGLSNENYSGTFGSYVGKKLANDLYLTAENNSKLWLAQANLPLLLLIENNLSNAISKVAGNLMNYGFNTLFNLPKNDLTFPEVLADFSVKNAKETWDTYNPNALKFDIASTMLNQIDKNMKNNFLIRVNE